MKDPIEICWYARGGQGAKTASLLLAETAADLGKFVQGFSDYGPERSGAPVTGFNRVGSKPINTHCFIQNPDIVIILDPTLIRIQDMTSNLTPDGIVIVNTGKSPSEVRKELKLDGRKIYTIDASKISLETIKRNIPNTPMLGALIKTTALFDIDSLSKYMKKKFEKKFKPEVLEGNIKAITRAYEEVAGE